jgi:glutamate synthase (NADPH) large chain
VIWQRVATAHWNSVLKDLVAEHALATQSRFAEQLLLDWERELPRFWQIVPKEMLGRLTQPLSEEARAAAGD